MGEAMTPGLEDARWDDGRCSCDYIYGDVRCLESQAKTEPVDYDLLFPQGQRVTREERDSSFYDL